MHNLKGKVALITGFGSLEQWGNGQAIAMLLARQGAAIMGNDVNPEAAAITQRLIEAEGRTCAHVIGDVTKSEDVAALVGACQKRYGRIDILVNNVGRSEPGGPVELSEETWNAQMDINLKTAYLMCKAVLPIMEKQGGGAVVNVASVAGLRYVG